MGLETQISFRGMGRLGSVRVPNLCDHFHLDFGHSLFFLVSSESVTLVLPHELKAAGSSRGKS